MPRVKAALVELGGPRLTLEGLRSLAEGAPAALGPETRKRVKPARELIDRAVRSGAPVYGVNTGFGALKSVRIADADVGRLQVNLLRSHAAGAGPELERPAVRLMLALRAHSLALGASGVRPELLEHLVSMLERDLLPIVPSRGSLGASGDLIPLAHLGLGVIGEGELRRNGRVGPAADQYRDAGLDPLPLAAKEGLALINGTQASRAPMSCERRTPRARSRSTRSAARPSRSIPASTRFGRIGARSTPRRRSEGSSRGARSSLPTRGAGGCRTPTRSDAHLKYWERPSTPSATRARPF
jgi:histidine ammonia-lyase